MFESASKPNATVAKVVKALAKQVFQQYFNAVDIAKLKVEDLKLYTMVLDVVVMAAGATLKRIAGQYGSED